jgi:aspartyl protease family protein
VSGDRFGEIVLYALFLILPLAALIARRPPLARTMLFAVAWAGIFAIGLAVVGQRDRLGSLLGNLGVEGRETRIRMAADGHFWADATINGVSRRMLIDSGATTTAISRATANAAGIDLDGSPFPVVLNTANGRVEARSAVAESLVVGQVTAHDLRIVVSPAFGDTDVIGMNFLSRLGSWRVENRTLVLMPRPPRTS